MFLRFKPQTKRADGTKAPLKLALVSCGLGNVKRGFEISTDRWYRALKDNPDLDVKLFRGGRHDAGDLVWNIPRDWVMNSPLAVFKLINRRRFWEFCYGVEQISFGLFFWPDLLKFNPDVVWIKEVPFGYFLPFYRAVLGLKFKIIFANGGGFKPQTFKDFEFIQHLTEASLEESAEFGIPREKMLTLTNGVPFRELPESRESCRAHFGYEDDDYVVVSVSAWNAYHKRLDYIIREVASVPDKRLKLLFVGHPDAETGVLKHLAHDLLGDRVQWHTLPEKEVQRALKASDVFVLGSLNECLGNATLEAICERLPVVLHNGGASGFILNTYPEFAVDLSVEGNLRDRIMRLQQPRDLELESKLVGLRNSVLERFSVESLAPRFYEMTRKLVDSAPKKLPVNKSHDILVP